MMVFFEQICPADRERRKPGKITDLCRRAARHNRPCYRVELNPVEALYAVGWMARTLPAPGHIVRPAGEIAMGKVSIGRSRRNED